MATRAMLIDQVTPVYMEHPEGKAYGLAYRTTAQPPYWVATFFAQSMPQLLRERFISEGVMAHSILQTVSRDEQLLDGEVLLAQPINAKFNTAFDALIAALPYEMEIGLRFDAFTEQIAGFNVEAHQFAIDISEPYWFGGREVAYSINGHPIDFFANLNGKHPFKAMSKDRKLVITHEDLFMDLRTDEEKRFNSLFQQ